MRILEVIGDLSLKAGGPPVSVISNGSALAALGHEVIVATTDANGEQLDLQARTSKVQPIFTFRHLPPEKLAISPGLTRFLWKSIPEFDVVIIHGLYHYPTMIASHLCMHFGVPYIVEPHGVLDPFMYKRHRVRKAVMETLFQNRTTKNAAAIWFSSEEEATLAKDLIHGAPSFVSPHILDLAEFMKCRTMTSFEDAFNSAIILFYGRVNFKKGLDLLIEALGLLQRRGVNCRLAVAGPIDESLVPHLKEWERKFAVTGKIEYLGSVKGTERLRVLSQATVFALPSYSENFGIAILEAMAAGLPVVISDKVNIYQEVLDAKAGWVVKCDARELADALQIAITDKTANRQSRDNTETFLNSHYSTSVNAKRLADNISETVDRFKRSRHESKG